MAEARDERPEVDIQVYDKHWFIKKEIALQYRCEICENILKDPQQIIVCGHQFCRSCLPQEVKKCPTCDEDVKAIFPDEAAKRKILAFEMKCPAEQCKWRGTLHDFEKRHTKDCPSHLVKCSNKACNEFMSREDLEKHLREECQYRLIDCRYCEDRITVADEKTHHDEHCRRIPVECPNHCGNEFPREEKQNHIDEECEMTLIDCTFNAVGCKARVERGRLREHEVDMVHEHLSQAVHVINNLGEGRQQMNEEIRQLHERNNNLTQEINDFREQQEVRTVTINADLQEFKEQGMLRLDDIQRATEQNFENAKQAVEQNGNFQETLLYIQQDVANLYTIISEIQATCLAHQTEQTKLTENHDKLQKMIVVVHNKFKSAIASLKEEVDTRLDTLCKADEEEHEARLQHEAETADKISRLHEDISENREKLEKLEVNLVVTQDEIKEGFSEHCKQMQLDYDNVSNMIKKERQSRENDFVQLSENISEMKSIQTGVFVWKIDNVDSKLKSVERKTKPLYGHTFYTEPYGHLLQPKLFFNGARLNDQGYLSLFIQIVQGPFDAILKWPFEKRIRFSLIEQESKRLKRDIEKILIPVADSDELRKPSDHANNGFGIYKFVSHEVLQAGRYIVDDVMFVKIEVLEDDEQTNAHSTTM